MNSDKKEQVLGVIRHILTFVGGILVTKGVLDDGLALELSGSLSTLVGLIWSVIAKNKATK